MRWYLSINTWKESVVGAKHYYGRFRAGSSTDEEDIEGSTFTREGMIKKAKAVWKKMKKTGRVTDIDFLTLGDYCSCDPQQILIGPKELKIIGNKIWKEFERLEGWDYIGGDKEKSQVEKLCLSWDVLMKDLENRTIIF